MKYRMGRYYHGTQKLMPGVWFLRILAILLVISPIKNALAVEPVSLVNPAVADILIIKSPTFKADFATIIATKEAEAKQVVRVNTPTREEIVAEIQRQFGKHTNKALAVLDCENRNLDVNATNWNRDKSTDRGIFQINSIHVKRFGTLFQTDWKENIRVARVIHSEQGWRPWTCAHKVGVKPFYLNR